MKNVIKVLSIGLCLAGLPAVGTAQTQSPGARRLPPRVVTTFKNMKRPNGVLRSITGKNTSLYNGSSMKQRRQLKSPMKAGPYTPTWSTDFSTQELYDEFLAIDANGDATYDDYYGYTAGGWNYSSDYGAFYYYSQNNADDWLISPGLQLEGGKTYYVEFVVAGGGDMYPEKFEVKYGTDRTVDAMTGSVLDVTEVATWDNVRFVETVTPETDGVYYIGFHVVSDAEMYALYLNSVKVSDEAPAPTPGEVDHLQVIPGENGARTATITFDAPTKASDGSDLGGPLTIKVSGGKLEDYTIKDATPGTHYEVTDSMLEWSGNFTYYVAVSDSNGTGRTAQASAYIGTDYPAAPAYLTLNYDPDDMLLTWEPSIGTNGGYINPDEVTYHIKNVKLIDEGTVYTGDEIGTATGQTEYQTGVGADQGDPEMYTLAVSASNDEGSSKAVASNTIMKGKPYDNPYSESFTNGEMHTTMLTGSTGNGVWMGACGVGVISDDVADGDNGSVFLQTGYKGDQAGLQTYKISMKNSVNPQLYFQQKVQKLGTNDSTEYYVYAVTPAGEFVQLNHEVIGSNTPDDEAEWKLVQYDLSDLKDYNWIQIGWELYCNRDNNQYTGAVQIDNIHVGDLAPVDGRINFTAPLAIKKGQEVEMPVTIINNGSDVISNYNLTVKVNGKEFYNENLSEEIESMGYTVKDITYPTNILSPDTINIVAVLTAEGDETHANDTCMAKTVLKSSNVIPATGLTMDMDTKTLSWTAPFDELEITDDFDSYDPWQINTFGGWTMFDGDGGKYHSFYDATYYPHWNEPYAFIIFNPYDDYGFDVSAFLKPHSGYHMLVSAFTWDDDRLVSRDDWAISPLLSGDAQTISFYLSTLAFGSEAEGMEITDNPEDYQVLYSTTTTDIAAFVAIDSIRTAATMGEYQQVSVDLPEGAKYFAIRDVSTFNAGSASALCVDDVTFTKKNEGTVVGYNIYRDGELLTYVPETSFVDSTLTVGDHTYAVTAVYETGEESVPVYLDVTLTGIRTPMATTDKQVVYTINGMRVSRPVHGVNIIDGKKQVIK